MRNVTNLTVFWSLHAESAFKHVTYISPHLGHACDLIAASIVRNKSRARAVSRRVPRACPRTSRSPHAARCSPLAEGAEYCAINIYNSNLVQDRDVGPLSCAVKIVWVDFLLA